MGRFDLRTRTGQISTIIQTNIGTSIDADAQAFFDRVNAAGGTLLQNEKDAVNTLVLSLKAANIWTLMKAIYPMVGSSAAACAQNLKSSSFTATFAGAWTFSSTGITPNGVNTFMDTTIIPSVNLIQNSSHLSTYIRTTIAGNQIFIGSRSGLISAPIYILNYGFIAVNNSDTGGTNVANQIGLFTNTRTSSTNLVQYKNNVALSTLSVASTGLNTRSIYVGAYNSDGTLVPTSSQCALATVGDGLTTIEQSNFYTAVQAFQTNLSRQV